MLTHSSSSLFFENVRPHKDFEDEKEEDHDEKHETSLPIAPSLPMPVLDGYQTTVIPTIVEPRPRLVISDNVICNKPGTSRIEQLPMELLGGLYPISFQSDSSPDNSDELHPYQKLNLVEIPQKCFISRNVHLVSLFLSSRTMSYAITPILYRQIHIPRSRTFRDFLSRLTDSPALGNMVRRLDFSHFNPTGAGMTARERSEMTNLTSKTLFQCLQLTPNLREFLAQEHIDDDLEFQVLEKLFCYLPNLEALDLTSCSSSNFYKSFTRLVESDSSPLPTTLSITRLCLHNCNSLPVSIFSTILPKLSRLTHLDVSHTQITDLALHSIPHTAEITHLNISRCSRLTSASIVDLLVYHSAFKDLVYLNLAMDNISSEMFDSGDIEALLPCLPRSLRSLNLKGSKMNASHLPLLLPLTKHLEELGTGRNLSLQDVIHLLLPNNLLLTMEKTPWIPHTLRYIDISDLDADQLDLGTMFGMSCPLLKSITEPLEVLEINPVVQKRVLTSSTSLKRVGWRVKEAGKRTSLVRERMEYITESSRDWKWGVIDWGMRKIPVARAGDRGMYGYWMFRYAK